MLCHTHLHLIFNVIIILLSFQMKIFKLVSTDKGILENNYRRLQDINERDVYLFTDNGASSISAALGLTFINFFILLKRKNWKFFPLWWLKLQKLRSVWKDNSIICLTWQENGNWSKLFNYKFLNNLNNNGIK